MTLRDVTQAKSKSKTGAGGTNSSVFDGIDSLVGSSGQLPVPKFTTVTDSSAKENGVTVKAAGGVAYDMKATTVVQIHSGLLNTAGNGWSETFKHS